MRRAFASAGKKAVRGLATASARGGAIDVHTHMYLPGYMSILRKRADIPYVRTIAGQDRLVILPGEDAEGTTSAGRPIGREYFDVKAKLQFMDVHGIQQSVVSLANPWLDFLEGEAAASAAMELNDELEGLCGAARGRLLGFAVLPMRNPQVRPSNPNLNPCHCLNPNPMSTPAPTPSSTSTSTPFPYPYPYLYPYPLSLTLIRRRLCARCGGSRLCGTSAASSWARRARGR